MLVKRMFYNVNLKPVGVKITGADNYKNTVTPLHYASHLYSCACKIGI